VKKLRNASDHLGTVYTELKKGTFLQNAQRRSQRRKSAWNLLLPLIGFPLWLLLTVSCVQLAWLAHVVFHPESAGLERQFFAHSLGLASSLIVFPILFSTLCPAYVVTNFLVYLILPARRAMENEDEPFPEVNYKSSQRDLIKICAVTVPIAIALVLVGAAMGGGLH
jgi:hypothetical protein